MIDFADSTPMIINQLSRRELLRAYGELCRMLREAHRRRDWGIIAESAYRLATVAGRLKMKEADEKASSRQRGQRRAR